MYDIDYKKKSSKKQVIKITECLFVMLLDFHILLK